MALDNERYADDVIEHLENKRELEGIIGTDQVDAMIAETKTRAENNGGIQVHTVPEAVALRLKLERARIAEERLEQPNFGM